jgi:hypothetical protein
LAGANGRAERLVKSGGTEADKIRSLYFTAFSRPPSTEESKQAEEYLARPLTDAKGEPVDPLKAKRISLEDLIWALMNAKEFLYNH